MNTTKPTGTIFINLASLLICIMVFIRMKKRFDIITWWEILLKPVTFYEHKCRKENINLYTYAVLVERSIQKCRDKWCPQNICMFCVLLLDIIEFLSCINKSYFGLSLCAERLYNGIWINLYGLRLIRFWDILYFALLCNDKLLDIFRL